MRESSKAALGGIVSALAIVIMLCTYLSPFLVYTAPPFAGLLLLIIVNEMGYKWSIGTYFTISLLSVFLIADKESAVFFTMFFGYYPILSIYLNEKMRNKTLRYILKLVIFNISIAISMLLCIFVFAVPYDEFTDGGIVFIASFAVLMNMLFVIYDILVNRIQLIYKVKLHKRFRKLFKR